MDQNKNIFLFSRLDEETVTEKLEVKQYLEQNGFTITEEQDEAGIIISIGSDGTFLQAVRKTDFRQDCLYIGIALDDRLGLYCDFQIGQLEELSELLNSPEIEERHYPLLEVSINNHQPYFCLNEFTIRSSVIRTFTVDILIDGAHFETFLGDGLIISTPTGSTAYNKSVRGAVIDPLTPCFQLTELASVNNNKYRTLGSPLVLSKDRKLTLHVHSKGNDFPATATDNEALGIRQIEIVEAVLSEQVIRSPELPNKTFFNKVQDLFL